MKVLRYRWPAVPRSRNLCCSDLHKNTTFHNYHQVKFAMVLVAGRDVINWEVPSRSREVKYVHWNLKISFLKLWNLSWNLKMACKSCAFLWNTMIFIAIEKFCCPPCTAGRCIYPSCSEPSSLAPFSIVLWKSKKNEKRKFVQVKMHDMGHNYPKIWFWWV